MNILGVKIDEINEAQAVEKVTQWIKNGEKRWISTPNIEFIMAAQNDKEFKKVLSQSDLAIPDSSRFGWAIQQLEEKNLLLKLLRWPLFFFPKSSFVTQFPVLPGTDLMEKLISESAENNWSIGLLGGKDGVAEKLKKHLEKKIPNLKITYAEPGGVVDQNGEVLWVEPTQSSVLSSQLSDNGLPVVGKSDLQTDKLNTGKLSSENRKPKTDNLTIPNTDLLFVAFGHGKQEKWIAKNLEIQPVKVMMGVGGAFDYLSGSIPRAPKSWQKNGYEWLYRLIQQPWRAKRFLSLIHFTFLILGKKSKTN